MIRWPRLTPIPEAVASGSSTAWPALSALPALAVSPWTQSKLATRKYEAGSITVRNVFVLRAPSSTSVWPKRTGESRSTPLTAASWSATPGSKAPGAATCMSLPAWRVSTWSRVWFMARLLAPTARIMASTTMIRASV